MSKKIVVGDIHGAYRAFKQCLELSKFDKEKDKLIVLGDTCDGWTETYECFEELLTIKNLTYILGNHDYWTLQWAKYAEQPIMWVSQGGYNTMESYRKHNAGVMPQEHLNMIDKSHLWIKDKGILFVHAGIDINKSMENQSMRICIWDRDLIQYARRFHMGTELRAQMKKEEFIRPTLKTEFLEIFVGHTNTLCFKSLVPVHYCNLWGIDTGGGWNGKVTFMDVETKEIWQSDYCQDLYPESRGRGDYNE